MLKAESPKKGKTAYREIPINANNSRDVGLIWKTEEQGKAGYVQTIESWNQFTCIAGQFVQLAIAFGKFGNPYDL